MYELQPKLKQEEEEQERAIRREQRERIEHERLIRNARLEWEVVREAQHKLNLKRECQRQWEKQESQRLTDADKYKGKTPRIQSRKERSDQEYASYEEKMERKEGESFMNACDLFDSCYDSD